MFIDATDTLFDEPLRQGDLFEWTGVNRLRPWQTFGFVITADCDLANAKTRNIVSYVPGLTTADYIWEFCKDKKFQRSMEDSTSKLARIANNFLKKSGRIESDISSDSISDWLARVGSNRFISEIGMTDKGQINDIQKVVEQVLQYGEILRANSPDIDLLCRCFALKSGANSDTKEAIIKEFKGDLSSVPGDIFHIPGIKEAPDGGIFLSLRNIRQCSVDEIGLISDDLRFGDATAKRIGRVKAPFKYAIMQNLARVFTDIGLPNEYQIARNNTSAVFFENGDKHADIGSDRKRD